MGNSRTLWPVAWNTALAIAGAVPTSAISPSPLTPSGLTCGSFSSTKRASSEIPERLGRSGLVVNPSALPRRACSAVRGGGGARRCAGPAATRSGTHDGSHLRPYLPHCEAVSSHHHEQVLVAATKNHPAWVAIAAQVSAQFRDRQHRVTCRRSRWKWHLRRVPQHGDVVGVQDRARGNVPV